MRKLWVIRKVQLLSSVVGVLCFRELKSILSCSKFSKLNQMI